MARRERLNRISRQVDGPKTKINVAETYRVGSLLLDDLAVEIDNVKFCAEATLAAVEDLVAAISRKHGKKTKTTKKRSK